MRKRKGKTITKGTTATTTTMNAAIARNQFWMLGMTATAASALCTYIFIAYRL